MKYLGSILVCVNLVRLPVDKQHKTAYEISVRFVRSTCNTKTVAAIC